MPRTGYSKPKPPQKYRDFFDYLGVFTFIAAVAAAICTGVATYYASKQARLASEAVAAANQSAAASITQANYSIEQAKIAGTELQVAHRPWVIVSDNMTMKVPLMFDRNGAHATVSAKMINEGYGPATGVYMIGSKLIVGPLPPYCEPGRNGACNRAIFWHNLSGGQYGVDACVPFHSGLGDIGVGVTFLMPNSSHDEIFQLATPRSAFTTLKEPGARYVEKAGGVWFAECIHYSDQFNHPHVTGLIFSYNPTPPLDPFPQNNVFHGKFIITDIGTLLY